MCYTVSLIYNRHPRYCNQIEKQVQKFRNILDSEGGRFEESV